MTEGTSQGLFIVVAIVIFGIFISLSYTVFGSMNDGLDGLFTTATEQSMNKLIGGEVIYHNGSKDFTDGYNYTIPSSVFEQSGSYTLTFDLDVVSGSLQALRGHLHTSSNVKVFIDGNLQKQTTNPASTFSVGYLFDEPYTAGTSISIKVVFVTDLFDDESTHSNKSIVLEPNVNYIGGHQSYIGSNIVNYRNVRVIKHN